MPLLCCGGSRHLDGILAEREGALLSPSPADQSLIRLCQSWQCCWSRQGCSVSMENQAGCGFVL